VKWPKNAGSIAVIAIALGLGAYVWWVEKDHVSDVERASRPKNVFPAFRRNELSRIELATGKEKLVFERQVADDAGDRDWRMTSPRDEKVEPDAIDRLLGALEFATFVRKVDDGQGMQPTRAQGSVTMGKLVLAFTLGQAAPAPEGASYFSVAGEGTFVVGKDVVTELLKGSDAYRSKSIVPYLSIDLSRLEIASSAETTSHSSSTTPSCASRVRGSIACGSRSPTCARTPSWSRSTTRIRRSRFAWFTKTRAVRQRSSRCSARAPGFRTTWSSCDACLRA